jgi:hypothetical protein
MGEGEGGGESGYSFTAPEEKAGVRGTVREKMLINELAKKSDER